MSNVLCEKCEMETFLSCPWVLYGMPLTGWEAEYVKKKKDLNTYDIKKCPRFKGEVSKCIVCGKEIPRNRKQYCSAECSRIKTLEKIDKYNKAKNKKVIKCIVCGEVLEGTRRKFCSEKCKWKYERMKKKENFNVE